MARKNNIAIYTKDFTWSGGIDLIRYIYEGISYENDSNFYLLVYKPKKTITSFIRGCLHYIKNAIKTKKIKWADFSTYVLQNNLYHDYNIILKLLNDVFGNTNIILINYNEKSLQRICEENDIKVILPVMVSPSVSLPVPTIGYIFDFVYRYQTQLYTTEFCIDTECMFLQTFKNNKVIIVNSLFVKNDANKFFPFCKNKVFNLPFAPFLDESIFVQATDNSDKFLNKYKLCKSRYFIICNQFWLHKGHNIAFMAFKKFLLKCKTDNIKLVCTGKFEDLSGTSNHIVDLKKIINELNIEEKVVFLGHIPKIEQSSLIINSICLIQPTTFEGGPGGGSVYQALSYGVRCIVSDIAVNLEIGNNHLVTYFEVNNYDILANKMLESMHLPPNIINLQTLKENSNHNLKLLSTTIKEAIHEAIISSI